jgi:ribose-phosphate pyrophosphokinase
MSSVKIFSGSVSRYLAEQISEHYGAPLGQLKINKFSDGEMAPEFNESIRGEDVFLINATCAPSDNLMELLLMSDAVRRASASNITAVIPYFGYARQDRKDKPRVAIGAKLVANLLTAAGIQRLMTLDLHAGQIQGFFDFPVDHLDATAIFIPYIKDLKMSNFMFASADVGGVGRARAYAKHFGVELAVCDKHRVRANEVATMQVIGDVSGMNVILVDDIIDTAGTLSRAAEVLMEKGALSVRAFCTHGIFSGPAYDVLDKTTALSEVVVTDSLPQKRLDHPKVKVLSVAPLFAKAIRRVHAQESISTLFL